VVPVTVSRLGLDAATQTHVVLLQEQGGERIVPIWIGKSEAESILTHMKGIPHDRPMTHDLCTSIIVGLGATLRRVQVTRVQHGTFFAELHLVRGGSPVIVDARPSDSIRLDAPIYVSEAILGGDPDEGQPEAGGRDDDPLSAEQLQRHLSQLRPEDFGKFSL
jgi:hypothetical protein